jgi:hypothetical protein
LEFGKNYLIYVEEGGQANVDAGSNLGMVELLIHSWLKISSIEGRFAGSLLRIFVIISRAESEIATFSGKLYAFIRILLYVVLTSDVSNGGLPIISV